MSSSSPEMKSIWVSEEYTSIPMPIYPSSISKVLGPPVIFRAATVDAVERLNA